MKAVKRITALSLVIIVTATVAHAQLRYPASVQTTPSVQATSFDYYAQDDETSSPSDVDTSMAPAVNYSGGEAGCSCDCGGGCNSGGCRKCGRCFVWGKDTWLKVGAGVRTSYSTVENAAPNGGSWSNDFNIDNARLYFNGQGHKYIKFEFNTDINNAQRFQDPTYPTPGSYDEAGDMRILDAIAKFEFHDLFNVWVGRFLPPSDRANLSGPFFQNNWDFPFVQTGQPNIFQGRDDGVAIWGQWGGGAVKYQVGAFEGVNGAIPGSTETLPILGANPSDDLMLTARVTVNLLDPEPGYYNQSTYYGDKDILAIGAAVMDQNNANVDGHARTKTPILPVGALTRFLSEC